MNDNTILIIGGMAVSLVSTLAIAIRRSRCTHVKCCGAECVRDVPAEDETDSNEGSTAFPFRMPSMKKIPPPSKPIPSPNNV